MKINDMLMKGLAFCLGIKHQSFEELADAGEKRMGPILLYHAQKFIDRASLERIGLIGAIIYSEADLAVIEEQLKIGKRVAFAVPSNFDFEASYIEFYQVETCNRQTYVLATSDMFDFAQEEEALLFLEVTEPYEVKTVYWQK